MLQDNKHMITLKFEPYDPCHSVETWYNFVINQTHKPLLNITRSPSYPEYNVVELV